MSKDEFQQLWKSYDAKLEKSMKLNHRLMTEIGTRKVHTSLNWQIVFKIMMIVLGIGWNVVVGSLLWRFRSEPVFVASAAVVLICTGYSIGGYIIQLLLILQIKMSETILGTQKQLAYLEAMIIRTLRVGFLQTPAYTTFYITRNMLATAGWSFWITQTIITGLAVLVTIWVFRTVTVKNAEKKKWLKQMVDNEGGKSIARARQFIREVKEWERE
jgi:flagellar biosynthesis protein FliP